MPKHLYTIPSGVSLPTDLTDFVQGSPFILDNGDSTYTLYSLLGATPTWVALTQP